MASATRDRVGPGTVVGMDRRTFLAGAGALGLVACAKPENDLLADYEGVSLPLEPAPVPPSTSMAGLTDVGPDDAGLAPVPDDWPYPVAVPEEDWPGLVFIAEAVVPSVVAHQTLGGNDASWEFTNPIASGGPLVFVVEEFDELNNFRVLLPTRPNGSFGWISAAHVQLRRHNYRILVELDAFRLSVFDHDLVIFEAEVGVARENTPTPQGRYYTTELLRPPEPDSVYGAFAYGLSGFSEVFTSFAGGPGQLGIHGTNDPSTIGTNVSSGCIRLRNEHITHIVDVIQLPTGVPVEVV